MKEPLPAAGSLEARPYAARRIVDPEVTLTRMQPLLSSMGITRISNITGLDYLNLPVVNVVRPNARSNAVFQGKGLDLASAKASGVMEAVETFCAERILRPLKLASAHEMARHHKLPDLAALPKPSGSHFGMEAPILWIEGRDIRTGESVWTPFELVHVNFTVPAHSGSGAFLLSSNGLASGNVLEEALSHGICELIERDAGALFDLNTRLFHERRVDLASIEDPYCRAIVDRVHSGNVAAAIWDITSDIGVAAFRCRIMERPGSGPALRLPALGEGCHPNRTVALLRSITEAAQARLSVIAGVRDDILPDMYDRFYDMAALERWWRVFSSGSGLRRFDSVPDVICASPSDEITHMLGRLRDAQLEQVIMVGLSPVETDEVAVVRVIVPGLEPLTEAACIPGRRARAVIGGLA